MKAVIASLVTALVLSAGALAGPIPNPRDILAPFRSKPQKGVTFVFCEQRQDGWPGMYCVETTKADRGRVRAYMYLSPNGEGKLFGARFLVK